VHPINYLCLDNVGLFCFTALQLLMFRIQNVRVSWPKIINGFRPSEIVYDLSIVILSAIRIFISKLQLRWFFFRLIYH
jgi:hypothetical protein